MADETKDVAVVQPSPAPPNALREMLAIAKEACEPEVFKAFAMDIIEREVARTRFGQDAALARVFANSGVFADIRVNDVNNPNDTGVALAMTKIQLGRGWNMTPADAMKSIYFIQGKPDVSSDYIAAKLRESGLDWDIAWDEVNGICTGCHLALKRMINGRYEPVMEEVNGQSRRAVVSFTKRDADGVMTNERGKEIPLSQKSTYKSFPREMYFNRAVSKVKKYHAPNVLADMGAEDDAHDHQIIAVDQAPRAIAAASATQTKQDAVGEALRRAAMATAKA